MSYEKQTWQTGDVVTSAKLNHMEDGIAAAGSGGGGGAFIVNATIDDTDPENIVVTSIDKTAEDVYNAVQSGAVVVAHISLAFATNVYVLPLSKYMPAADDDSHAYALFSAIDFAAYYSELELSGDEARYANYPLLNP